MSKRAKLWFLILTIGLCLIVPILTAVLPPQPLRANETAVAKPRLVVGGHLNTGFFSDLTDWYAASFAFRHEAITADSLLRTNLFCSSTAEDVVVGRDGWLYYASSLPDFRGERVMTGRELQRAAITLSLLQEGAENAGMEFLFFAAPNKNTIYPEHMPLTELPGNAHAMPALYEVLEARGVNALDLTPVLTGAEETVYHRTDSHWNNLGAALAQHAILGALGLEGADFTFSSYEIREDFTGDLWAMLYPALDGQETQQYYDMGSLQETGTPDDLRYETFCPDGEGVLFLYRDSFGNALCPFLAAAFREAFFSRSSVWDLDAAVEVNADIFAVEIVERNLGNLLVNSPVMAAPVRENVKVSRETEDPVTASTHLDGVYLVIEGAFSPDGIDEDSPIYACVDGIVYEAFPVGSGEGEVFTLRIPADASASRISVLYRSGGETVATQDIPLA